MLKNRKIWMHPLIVGVVIGIGFLRHGFFWGILIAAVPIAIGLIGKKREDEPSE